MYLFYNLLVIQSDAIIMFVCQGIHMVKKIKIESKSPVVKKKALRSQYASDEKYTGIEPVWDTERAKDMSDEQFDHFLRKSFYYYNYHFSQKDLRKLVNDWVTNDSKYNKDEIKIFEKLSDSSLPMTLCSIIAAHNQGMPLRDKVLAYINNTVRDLIDKSGNVYSSTTSLARVVKPQQSEVKMPSIQDRIAEKTSEILGDFEGMYDDVILKNSVNFKPYDFFKERNVAQSQIGKFEKLITSRQAEILAAQKATDPQLKEAYRHFKTADFKRHLAFFKICLEDIEQYKQVKKATKKARIKKPTSKDKLVAKLQYLREDKNLKLISINPIDVIGAKELWIYNVKTRKLGRYIAEDTADLAIKGTTIINFDPMKSITKTIRKPDEKLKEFFKASKAQLKKFIQDIKATETRLTGRINVDVILLRVQ